MRKLILLIFLLLLGFTGLVFWFWDQTPPEVEWKSADIVGKDATIGIDIRDSGKGLQRVELTLTQSGEALPIASDSFESTRFPWQKSSASVQHEVSLKDLAGKLKDGPFDITVSAIDQSNLWFFSRDVTIKREFRFDSKPPRISPLSRQHYLKQGGAESIRYSVSEPGCRSGVQVGESVFVGYPVPNSDGNEYIALFALGHDQEVSSSQVKLWAQDEAGNHGESSFWIQIQPQKFRSRRITVSDSFIEMVAPGILEHSPEISEGETLLETFLKINRDLRLTNNRAISEMTRTSEATLLWTEPFLQLTNSQVESVFADRRSYEYQGKIVDEQTHLGFDLASLANSPVEASNSGKVVFADYHGIYGNMVVLDHGLGLFSLYAHLSSIGVHVGDRVQRGQSLGQTGSTGLAGGDHLHFSMVLQGVQISPLEWWDPSWVQIHVLDRLEG